MRRNSPLRAGAAALAQLAEMPMLVIKVTTPAPQSSVIARLPYKGPSSTRKSLLLWRDDWPPMEVSASLRSESRPSLRGIIQQFIVIFDIF
jgi:hypothetical protein